MLSSVSPFRAFKTDKTTRKSYRAPQSFLSRFGGAAAWLKLVFLALLISVLGTSRADAQAFASCGPDVYLAQNSPTALYRVDTSTNPFTYPQIGATSSYTYNAIAFNPADNYIYGVTWNSATKQVNLLRIASTGAVTNLGAITGGGINGNNTAPASGEIGADGYYYLKFNTPGTGGGVLYRVNLSNLSSTTATTLSLNLPSADLAWYNGYLYSHSTDGRFYKINPANGAVTIIGQTGITVAFGALFSASNGIFGANNDGGFYQFNPNTGKVTLISSSPASGNNDGAKCFNTPLVFGADLAVTKTDNTNFYTPGGTTTYTMVVSNNGPFGVEGAIINDPLPSGTSSATWTCGAGTNGGTCGTGSGTGAISNVPVDLPPNATVTFTMTLSIPASRTGNLTNTITVTPPDTAADPTPGNNTATDTDAGVTIAKSLFAESGSVPNAAEPGETLTYHVTLTNTGNVAVSGYNASDRLDANTTFVSASNGGANAGGVVNWTNLSIPANGSLVLTVVATVNNPIPTTATTITNLAYPTGGDEPPCPSTQCVTIPVVGKIGISKTLVSESGTQAGIAEPGETLTYQITLSNTGAATTGYNLVDLIDAHVTFVSASNGGANSGNQVNWNNLSIPALSAGVPGTLVLTVVVRVANPIPAGVLTIQNLARAAAAPDPPCPSVQCVITPTAGKVSIAKTLVAESGTHAGFAEPGETLTYHVTLTNTGGSDVVNYAVDDVLDPNLEFVSADQGGTLNGRTISWTGLTVPAQDGASPNSIVLTVIARVANPLAANVTQVANLAKVAGGPDPACPSGQCVETPVAPKSTVTYAKTADATQVKIGDVVTYTVTTTITGASTSGTVTLTDTLGTGLTFKAVTDAGGFTCNAQNPLVCTLPAGTAIGTHTLTYTATVNAQATGSVRNAVVGTGDDNPTCAGLCTTDLPVILPQVSYAKTASTAGPVKVGDTITYTLTTTISNAANTSDVILLTDTLGTGLTFGQVVNAGAYQIDTSGAPVERFTLPAGTAPGTYTLSYTATVNAQASESVKNAVVGSGGDNPTCTTNCGTDIPVVSKVTYSKAADATQVKIGDVVTYTLLVSVSNASTSGVVTLTDTLGTGLTFKAVTDPDIFTCNAQNPLVCSLPTGTAIGTYRLTYTATVNAQATGSVKNAVVGIGDDSPTCTVPCATDLPVISPEVSYAKTANTAGPVKTGDVITYTLSTTVANAATTSDVVLLTDTLGTGLTFGSVVNAGAYQVDTSGAPVERFTLPAGKAPGTYSLTYTATVNAQAADSVKNAVVGSGGDNPVCTTNCGTDIPVVSKVTYSKSADATQVKIGDVVTYTLRIIVSDASTTGLVTLTDTPGTGLTLKDVTYPGLFTCSDSAPLVCPLPAGTAIGTYTLTYTATVNPLATGTVRNAVVGTGDDQPTCAAPCATSQPVISPAVSYAKTADTTGPVKVGDVITYTLSTTVANAATTADVVLLTDTLGTGLTFNRVVDAGDYQADTSGAPVERFTLPAGKAPGTYHIVYSATVTAQASGSVKNAVVGSGGDNPVCTTDCGTEIPVVASAVTYAKTVSAAGPVQIGDVLTYTLTATVTNTATSGVVTLTDTLGAGLTFKAVTSAGAFTCNTQSPLVCTLPSGAAVGTYAIAYTATVNAQASGSVTNAVVGSGNDKPTCAGTCGTQTPLNEPVISVVKSSSITGGSNVYVGQAIPFTLTATVANTATTEPLILTDTPDPGFTLSGLPGDCKAEGATVVCTLAAGAAIGTHSFNYTATVNDKATTTVKNQVTATGGGGNGPTCTICSMSYQVQQPYIHLTKTAAVHNVNIGDLVRYTLTVENVGTIPLVAGHVIDTPPAGFTYVEGSLRVSGDDDGATASGQSPLRFDGLDVAAGKTVTLAYLMRVGAGVRPGIHANQALVYDTRNAPVSNAATAEVELVADPLLDDSLIFGTVFNDRDGDGWQDSATLTRLHASGGFLASAYIAGSTSVERGHVDPPVEQSLLQGLDLGDLAGRQSDADPVNQHQIIIRQSLSSLAFDDSFTLTDQQGITIHMDAAGHTRTEKKGDAAKGLTSAEVSVERHVSPQDSGYVVEYLIRNAGVDERGIPGVRIASVEGLRVETDPYGRYHVAGVSGGTWERGRNFILKVDPATLPEGAKLTTPNPLVRRITPGLPVRFDFGVQLPVAIIGGGTTQVELELGSVIFAPGNADIDPAYLPAIDRVAEKTRQYQGGDIVIDSNGETDALALKRAEAVRDALAERLDADTAKNLTISVRTHADDPASTLVGLAPSGITLGVVLFDTGKASVKPGYDALLDDVAARISQAGGGVVTITGYTDVRGSFAYNVALGLRRARAVQDALSRRLPPELRDKVRVETGAPPAHPGGGAVKEEPGS